MQARKVAGLSIVLIVAAGLGVVNALKAVHIDDALYLSIALQILDSPLDPFGGVINWQQIPQPAYEVSISPPLISYYLAAAMLVFGDSSAGLHLAMSVWLLMAAWAAYRLAQRWTAYPLPVALLVVCSPATVVGMNLMLDVPLLACILADL